MSNTSRQVLASFLKREKRYIRNDSTGPRHTITQDAHNSWALRLHGNNIAEQHESDGSIWATLAGWPTMTTRSRLNDLCNALDIKAGFFQADGKQYFSVIGIDGVNVDREITSTMWVQLS